MDYRYTIEQIETGIPEGFSDTLAGAYECIEASGCPNDDFAIYDNETGEYVPQ